MNEHDTVMQNPLYEKLSRRFSYSGQTVGEMMLSRAAACGEGGAAREDVHGLTTESMIVRANHLPRPAKSRRVAACVGRVFPFFRISASSLMALLLSFVILSYVFFAGIHHNSPLLAPPELLSATTVEAELYAPAADVDEIL